MFSCFLQLPFLLRTNLTAKLTNSIAKPMNSIANGTNSIAKATNSIANRTNSIAKPTNSIANGTNSIAKATNSIANGTNSIAKLPKSIAKTCNLAYYAMLLCSKILPIMLIIMLKLFATVPIFCYFLWIIINFGILTTG